MHTAHTTEGSLGGVLTLGRADVCNTQCVRSSPAEVNWRRVDCNTEVVCASSQSARCAVPSGECADVPVCRGWRAPCTLVLLHGAVSQTEEKAALQSFAARCTLHAPTNPPPFPQACQVFESLSHLGFKLCGNLQLTTFSWVSKKI